MICSSSMTIYHDVAAPMSPQGSPPHHRLRPYQDPVHKPPPAMAVPRVKSSRASNVVDRAHNESWMFVTFLLRHLEYRTGQGRL